MFFFSCANLDSGECYTFGSNQFGQLGVDGNVKPRQVQKVTSLEHIKITKAACGDTFTTAVSEGLSVCLDFVHIERLRKRYRKQLGIVNFS